MDSKLSWLYSKKYRWLFHLLFWVFIYSDQIIVAIVPVGDFPPPSSTTDIHYEFNFLYVLLSDLAGVYVNLYLLIPFLLFRQKIWQYIVAFAILTFSHALLHFCIFYFGLVNNPGEQLPPPVLLFYSLFLWYTLQLIVLSSAIKIFKTYYLNLQKIKLVETERLKVELAYLKQQISPHFLFNALNNIVTLSEKYPEKVGRSVILLARLLRYQLQDGARNEVNLSQDIDNIKNYLEMDKSRRTDLNIGFNIIGDPSRIFVAPFLFLPFVENALKHGADERGSNNIDISFNIVPDCIKFSIRNDKPAIKRQTEKGGIGLKNVRRRLELLYPEKHSLHIEDMPGYYQVHLQLTPT